MISSHQFIYRKKMTLMIVNSVADLKNNVYIIIDFLYLRTYGIDQYGCRKAYV